jgi:mRNA interferase MazF
VTPLRGEIYWIDWTPHRGSEQAGHRPGLVISADAFNRQFRVCTVLAITTQVRPSQLAVVLPKYVTGEVCMILPWQIMTISENRLDEIITTLDQEFMVQVEQALHVIWRLS